MKNLKTKAALLALATFFVSDFCSAASACPPEIKEPTYINGLSYSVNTFQPRIHFRNQPADTWAYLGYYQGVNTYYGRALYSLALTAYATSAPVKYICSRESVDGLWIADAGAE